MRATLVVVVLGLVACKAPATEGAGREVEAGALEVPRDSGAGATVAPRDSGAGAGAGAGTGGGGGGGDSGAERELTVEVHGGNCPPDRQLAPGCRSYTLVLRSDGTLRGGKRKSPVPADETEATLRLATEAFAAKLTCYPNPPDRGGQAVLLRVGDVTQAARGGCGPRIDALRTRLEKLASGD